MSCTGQPRVALPYSAEQYNKYTICFGGSGDGK